MILREWLLRRRGMAAAATAGPWTVADDRMVAQGRRGSVPEDARAICDYFWSDDAAHIAANDPTTVTALLDVVLASEAAGPWPLTRTFYDQVEQTETSMCMHCRRVGWTLRDGSTNTGHRDGCPGIAIRDALARLDALIGSAALEDA